MGRGHYFPLSRSNWFTPTGWSDSFEGHLLRDVFLTRYVSTYTIQHQMNQN